MITTKLQHILVPSDLSETANHALRYASDLARKAGARLTLIYSDSFVPAIDYEATTGGWGESSFVELKARATEQLQHDAEMNIDPSVSFDVLVRESPPLEGIVSQAQDSGAGLIVMGTHGRTGFRRFIIGSVTEAMMRQAEVPVIAVPLQSGIRHAIKTVVCPVLCNAQCLEALTFAAQIVPKDARFIVIRTTPPSDVARSADDLFELRAWVPQAIATRCELKVFASEHIASQIDSFAKEVRADLIVATEPTERSASDWLHGTFAARLVQHSECPVLTVNGPARWASSHISRQEHRTEGTWANQ